MFLLQLAGIGAAYLVLLYLIFHKNRKIRGVSGALLSLLSASSFAVFLNAYYASGGPDVGKEWMQIFFPGLVFMVLFTAGALGFVSAFRKNFHKSV